MKALLDTDICIYLITRRSQRILESLAAYEPGEVGLSSITVAELCYGVAKLFEEFDLETYRALNDVVSGHSLKHLFAAGAGLALLLMLYRRRESMLDGGDGA